MRLRRKCRSINPAKKKKSMPSISRFRTKKATSIRKPMRWPTNGVSGKKSLLAHAAAGDLAWKFPIPAAVSAKSAKLSVQTAAVDENDQRAHPLVTTSGGAGLIVVSGPNPDNETYSVTLKPGAGVWTSLGIEVDTDASLAGGDIARGSDRFVITEIDASYSPDGRGAGKKTPFIFAYSTVSPTSGFPGDGCAGRQPENRIWNRGQGQGAVPDFAFCAAAAYVGDSQR